MPDQSELDAASDLVDLGSLATPHVAPGAPPKVENAVPALPPEQHPKIIKR